MLRSPKKSINFSISYFCSTKISVNLHMAFCVSNIGQMLQKQERENARGRKAWEGHYRMYQDMNTIISFKKIKTILIITLSDTNWHAHEKINFCLPSVLWVTWGRGNLNLCSQVPDTERELNKPSSSQSQYNSTFSYFILRSRNEMQTLQCSL